MTAFPDSRHSRTPGIPGLPAFPDSRHSRTPGIPGLPAFPDIDAVVRFGVEVVHSTRAARCGGVIERPGTVDALRREAAGLLAGPDAWTWLAERDGTAIGMLAAERPESAGWIARWCARLPLPTSC